MKLIDNEAIDFICAVQRFARRDRPIDPDYQGIPELIQWCEKYEKILSPFLLSDMALLAEKMVYPTYYLYFLIHDNPSIDTGEKLLKNFSDATEEEFATHFISHFLIGKNSELTKEDILQSIQDDGLYPGHDPVLESELLFGSLQEPGDFQKRLHRTYLDFYHQAYLPAKKSLKELAKQKLRWHQQRMDSAGVEQYLTTLGMNDFAKDVLPLGEISLYFSLFQDNDVSVSWGRRTAIVGGGTDQRILSQSARDKADTFFSCLGDAKRLEILRLTAQRPWYSTELAEHFDVKPATLSYHINKLVNANLLHLTKGEQRRFYYRLNKKTVREYLDYVVQDLIGLDEGCGG